VQRHAAIERRMLRAGEQQHAPAGLQGRGHGVGHGLVAADLDAHHARLLCGRQHAAMALANRHRQAFAHGGIDEAVARRVTHGLAHLRARKVAA
jgi:hypothetical protein